MNRIYLDKLCEFAQTTYKNYVNNNTDKHNIDEIVNKFKQNNSLNEKGLFIKHNFIDLISINSNFEFDELILINPLCFNVHGDIEWYNFLNSLLTILNNNYINEDNIIKKKILETADKTYRKKINITKDLNDVIINEISLITNISIIIIDDKSNKIYNFNQNNNFIVLFKNNKEYYPIINWNKKYYNYNNEFIKYLKKIIDNEKVIVEENDFENYKKKNLIKIINDDEMIKEQIEELKTKNDAYKELTTNENYALYISEAIDNNKNLDNNKNISTSDTKKKIKKTKNIFVINKNTEKTEKTKEVIKENLKDNNSESIFVKTEQISKKDIKDIKNKLKLSLNLPDLQSFAIKLNMNIFSGSNKNGKPKNKTKNELYNDIIEFINKNIND